MPVHRTDQELWLTIWEGRNTLLRGHEFFNHIMCPRALSFIEDCNALRRDIIVTHKGISILVDNLDKCRGSAQSICFGNAIALLPFLVYFVTSKGFLKDCHQGKVAGKEHSMLALLGIGSLDGDIQTYQGLACSRHAGDKADGLSAMGLAVIDDTVDLIRGNGQIFGACVAAGDVVDVMAAVQGLGSFDDGGCGEIFGILPCQHVSAMIHGGFQKHFHKSLCATFPSLLIFYPAMP